MGSFSQVLSEQTQKNSSKRPLHTIRQDYVQQLLSNVPNQGTDDIQIFENPTTLATETTPTFKAQHDAIEGYKIETKPNQPSTLVLKQPEQTITEPETAQEDEQDEEALLDDAMETMMMLKELNLDTAQPEELAATTKKAEESASPPQPQPQPPSSSLKPSSSAAAAVSNPADVSTPLKEQTKDETTEKTVKNVKVVVPSAPSKPKKKKKSNRPEMSMFGKIWTMTDRLTTHATRRYFEALQQQTYVDVRELIQDEDVPDEAALMRGQIFSERILES